MDEKGRTVADYLDMETAGNYIHVPYSHIVFLESDGDKVHIHLNNRTLSVYKKLSEIMTYMDKRFAQTHKSYVINLDYLDDIDTLYKNIRLTGQSLPIPISRRKKKEFIEHLKEYVHGYKLI
ncbi:MAG: LytTR family transcriptional regulator [Oscillospiraceae bacterium]|nr:LytTR family transcriptional regulator [Oscillospiraceae bacterium]